MPTVGRSMGFGLGRLRARAAPFSWTKCSVYSCIDVGLSASAAEAHEHDGSVHFSLFAIVEEAHVEPPPANGA